GDHRHSAAGDRGDAAGARGTVSPIRAVPRSTVVDRCGECAIDVGSRSAHELGPFDMKAPFVVIGWLAATSLLHVQSARGGQAPGSASDPDVPISHRDRIYAAEQFSNTVSVTDPVDNKLLGVIRLGDPTPGNLSPLYRGQLLVHGMGFSPDHRTIAVVSIGSNSVTFNTVTLPTSLSVNQTCLPSGVAAMFGQY